MTACGPHDRPEHREDECIAGVRRSPAQVLICYLGAGHDGGHYDACDHIHWRVNGDGQIITTPCEAKT